MTTPPARPAAGEAATDEPRPAAALPSALACLDAIHRTLAGPAEVRAVPDGFTTRL